MLLWTIQPWLQIMPREERVAKYKVNHSFVSIVANHIIILIIVGRRKTMVIKRLTRQMLMTRQATKHLWPHKVFIWVWHLIRSWTRVLQHMCLLIELISTLSRPFLQRRYLWAMIRCLSHRKRLNWCRDCS